MLLLAAVCSPAVIGSGKELLPSCCKYPTWPTGVLYKLMWLIMAAKKEQGC